MADSTKNSGTGGNKPKPTGAAKESAKDRSRAASRPVSGKPPKGKGGNTPRPGSGKGGSGRGGSGKAAPAGGPPGRRGQLIAWSAIGVVVIIIGVLVVVKATSSTPTSYTPVTAAPAQVVNDIKSIPLSTWNKVGVTSTNVAKPTVLSNQPAMTLNGKSPAMLYYGAEYCPYCAAERWGMATALARFGTWSNLQITASSHTDVDADTHTFSFHGASLDSPYIHFVGVETCSNVPDSSNTACNGYKNLQNPTEAELKVLTKYSSSKYLPNASQDGGISFPFVDINNGLLFSGASYDPQILAGSTWTEISGGLDDPTNPITQVILTTGNYMSAGICKATKGQPGSVCKSSGVEAAAKALGISSS